MPNGLQLTVHQAYNCCWLLLVYIHVYMIYHLVLVRLLLAITL